LQQFLYFHADVQALWTWKDLEFKCIYNYADSKREMLWYSLKTEKLNYTILNTDIPFSSFLEK
jgi:hypothetical protein